MSKTDIIVIGTATFDTFLKGFKYEIINSNVFTNGKALALGYGEKEKTQILEYHAGGGAVNIASCLSGFGLKTSIISRIAKDYSGEFVFKRIKEKKNIQTQLIEYDRKEKTSSSVILIAGNGEKTILSYKGCSLNLEVNKKSLNNIRTKVLVTSTMMGNVNNFEAVFEYKKKYPETLLVANPGFSDLEVLKKNVDWLKNYDVFVLNQEEASYLTDLDFKKEKEIFNWLNEHVQGVCIMTRGPEGLMFSEGNDIYMAKISQPVVVIDGTGAGDGFLAGFILGYYKEKDTQYGIKFGLANSTQIIEKIGAHEGVINPEDLKLERWKNKFEIINISKLS